MEGGPWWGGVQNLEKLGAEGAKQIIVTFSSSSIKRGGAKH